MAVTTHSRTERAIRALSRPLRRDQTRIIELLRQGERCLCELTDTLDAAQSGFVPLRVLKTRESSAIERMDGGFTTSSSQRCSKRWRRSFAMKPRVLKRADQCCA